MRIKRATLSRLCSMRFQVGEISSLVRDMLPTAFDQARESAEPHRQSENT